MVEFDRVPSLVIVEAHCRACAPIELGVCYDAVDDDSAAEQKCHAAQQLGDSGVALVLENLKRFRLETRVKGLSFPGFRYDHGAQLLSNVPMTGGDVQRS